MITIEELRTEPCQVLTRAEVAARWNVSEYFVRQHNAELGGQGKPRRYDALLCEEFFRTYFRSQKIKAEENAELVRDLVADLTMRTGAQAGKPRGNVRPILRAVAR